MTTVTTVGLEHAADLLQSSIKTIALGTDGTAEKPSNTALKNEVYRQSAGATNIAIIDEKDAEIAYRISIKGGLQISGGTKIKEIGLFADSKGGQNAETLVIRDTFNTVELTSGKFTTFEIKVPVKGGQ